MTLVMHKWWIVDNMTILQFLTDMWSGKRKTIRILFILLFTTKRPSCLQYLWQRRHAKKCDILYDEYIQINVCMWKHNYRSYPFGCRCLISSSSPWRLPGHGHACNDFKVWKWSIKRVLDIIKVNQLQFNWPFLFCCPVRFICIHSTCNIFTT